MSSPPWYMHLPCGISPLSVHKSHIEMTKLFGILSPLFFMNRQMDKEEGGKEKKIWGRIRCMRGTRWMRKWSLNKRQNTLKNATKYKVNMTC